MELGSGDGIDQIIRFLGGTDVFGVVRLDRHGVVTATHGQLVDWIPVGSDAFEQLPFLAAYRDDLRGNGEGKAFRVHLPNLGLPEPGDGDRVYSVFVGPTAEGSGTVLLFQDTTAFPAPEREAARSRDELALVRRELDRAREDAARATELKDKVISLVAHDLRMPLASVIQFFELLKSTGSALSGDMAALLESEEDNCWSAINQIEQLLDVNRLRSGIGEPVMETVTIAPLVDMVIDKLSPTASAKGIDVVNDLPPDFALRVDASLLSEVVRHLLTNAIKFGNEGSKVTVLSPDVRAGVIQVRDTGIGIPGKRLTTLFTLGENETTRGTGGERGTGFGLPLSRDMVRAMGGDLTATSTPGEGSEFSISLPDSVV